MLETLSNLSAHSNQDISGPLFILLGSLRQSLNGVPKHLYSSTLATLVELQQDDIAMRLAKIVIELQE